MKLPSLKNVNKTWVVLGVALAIGLVAALSMRRFLSTQMAAMEARSRHTTADLLVARAEIVKGSLLSRDNIAVRHVPLEFAHSGAVKPDDFERIDGKVIAYSLKPGELIMWSQMEGKRAPTFSSRVQPGMRALTFVVDEINSISGMLEPGDRIDLMFTIDQNGKKVVLPLLQSVEVMATGQRSVDDAKSGERTQFATVTLNTTPDQAKNIIVARESGKLTALLRNPDDKLSIGDRRYDLASLFGGRLESRRAGARRTIPVLYGGSTDKLPPEAVRLFPYRGIEHAPAPSTATAPIPPPVSASAYP